MPLLNSCLPLFIGGSCDGGVVQQPALASCDYDKALLLSAACGRADVEAQARSNTACLDC